jgi:hypothetical protein
MSHERNWRKSSYSNDTIESACVEVSLPATARSAAHAAFMPVPVALVRDSKATGRDVLAFSIGAWRAFVASVA